MVDVLEELAVDPLVDGSHDPFGIDEQDGDSRLARGRSGA
jgi:hypothetical protein